MRMMPVQRRNSSLLRLRHETLPLRIVAASRSRFGAAADVFTRNKHTRPSGIECRMQDDGRGGGRKWLHINNSGVSIQGRWDVRIRLSKERRRTFFTSRLRMRALRRSISAFVTAGYHYYDVPYARVQRLWSVACNTATAVQ